jgi:hypothetical protein
MTLFKNPTAQAVWLENWCERCWRDQCPILERGLRTDRKPKEWDRNPRTDLMAKAYRCNEFRTKPPRAARQQQFEDVPMFDVDETDARYVPVDNWPERPSTRKDVDHA